MVGPKVNPAYDGNTITTPYSNTPSDDELFDAANMSKQRDCYVSETESDTESWGTMLDLANQHENREVNYIPSSQDLFSSQGFQNNLARHKRSGSMYRSLESYGSSSKLTKSGDNLLSSGFIFKPKFV